VQPAARAEIDGRLAPKVHYAYPGMISLYHPFIVGSGALGSTARTADPYFMFQTTGATAASSSTVAHEVGHYMSHVLLGDDSMATLEAQANKHHEMGDAHSGRPMLEEYAMFADYFMWGKTSGSINMEDPINVLNLLHSSTPAQIDWPSREGYATCLMTVLHAGKSQVTTGLSGAPENIPVIGASFTELWGMLANKPLNVNSLRTGVASYLNGRSKIDALPVLLERTGWSYHGTGKIVDGNAQPLAGAKVQNIAIVSSENRQYPTGNAQATTDNSGNFTLGRLCPGNSIIRVWVGNDSTDISIAIDADKPTNTAIDLGTLSIGRQSDMYLLDQFKLLSQTGIYEEPYHANVIIPILDRMITAKRLTLNLAYYRTPGSKSMILFADDSTDLFVGCDYTSTAADVVNVYDFRGTLTNGTLHSIWVAGSAGFENYATGWMESTLTLSGNTISGTLIFDGKRWVQDPNDPNKLVLKSQGIRTYSIHGTRQ
jgi:hypothetical protein